MNIYSTIQPERLLHIIHHKDDFVNGRADLTAAETPLQVAAIKQPQGKTFRPHYHKENIRSINRTNECWVIISGKVMATYYDIDNTVIRTEVLEPGDITITIDGGGHNYLFIEDGIIYEIKNGPFLNVDCDKNFIE